jgi:hypothetical protein
MAETPVLVKQILPRASEGPALPHLGLGSDCRTMREHVSCLKPPGLGLGESPRLCCPACPSP